MRSNHGSLGPVGRFQRRFFVRALGTAMLGTSVFAAEASPESARRPGGAADRWFTTSDGVRLHYVEHGMARVDQPTYVFVPGWTMPAWIWQLQLEHFGATTRALALDPRGQGRSTIAAGGYDYGRRAADIGELLGAARCRAPVVLVAWSLGVLESLQLMHDQRQGGQTTPVRALVLVDNSVGVGDPPASDPTFFNRLRARRRETVSGFVNAMFKRPPAPAWLDDLVEASLRTPLQVSIDLLRQNRPREFWRDALLATEQPVLYAFTPRFAQQGEIVRQRKPQGIETRVFNEAGHALFVDEPAAFNELLERFVERTLGAQASPSGQASGATK